MRFVFIVSGFESFGVRRITLDLLKELRRKGHELHFVSFNNGPFTVELQRIGVPVKLLHYGSPPRMATGPGKLFSAVAVVAYQLQSVPILARKLKELGPAEVIVQWPYLLVSAGLSAAVARNSSCSWLMPCIVRKHYPLQLNRYFFQIFCRLCGVLPLANSRYTAQSLGNELVHPQVLYLGVDFADFSPSTSDRIAGRRDLELDEQNVVFGVLARFIEKKGQILFLEGFIQTARDFPDTHLLFVGASKQDPLVRFAREMAITAGLEDRVHFRDFQDAVTKYYAACDIIVNSSLDPEPFGLSVIEAMMMARPVLVHALGGPAETVIDGVTGWHVARATANDFAQGIRRAMGARQDWAVLGRNAREHSLKEFTIEQTATRLAELCTRYEERSTKG